MQISRVGNQVTLTKEPGDPRIQNESGLFYKLRNVLKKMGEDVIKKEMAKDGHMVSDRIFYVRSRNVNRPGAYGIFDNDYAVRDAAKTYNERGEITLMMISLLEGYEPDSPEKGPKDWSPLWRW